MIREITITPVLNGFVCKVGCQKVVFESASEMARNLEAYYKNPEAVEKEFIGKAVNKMCNGPQQCVPPPPYDEVGECADAPLSSRPIHSACKCVAQPPTPPPGNCTGSSTSLPCDEASIF